MNYEQLVENKVRLLETQSIIGTTACLGLALASTLVFLVLRKKMRRIEEWREDYSTFEIFSWVAALLAIIRFTATGCWLINFHTARLTVEADTATYQMIQVIK